MHDTESVADLPEPCLNQLALQGQPFTDTGSYYEDHDREIRLTTACDLLRAGATVVVTGVAGCGKTTSLCQLADATDDLAVTRVAGHGQLRLTDLMEALGVANEDDPPAAMRYLLEQAPRQPVLAIDNGETLPLSVLHRLAKLKAALTESCLPLPVIVACDRTAAPVVMKALATYHSPATQLQQITLSGFEPVDTAAYVRFRLAQVGGEHTLLSDRQLARIHRRSRGVPAAINNEAARELRRSAGHLGRRLPLPSFRLMPPRAVGRTVLGAGSAVALLAAGGLWWAFKETSPTPPRISNDQQVATASDSRVRLPASAETTRDDPNTTAEPTADNALSGTPAAQKAKSSESNDGASRATPARRADSDPPAWMKDPEVEPPAAPAKRLTARPNDATGSQASETAKPADASPRVEGPRSDPGPAQERQRETTQSTSEDRSNQAKRPDDSNLALDQGWYTHRPPNHFTIQILGAEHPETVQRFLGQISEPETTRVISSERDGSQWYVVVSGDYSDRADANDAIDALPESWRTHGAFPRRFRSLSPND